MEADAVVQLIGSLGFPIAMCILIFWYLMKETENHKNMWLSQGNLKDGESRMWRP